MEDTSSDIAQRELLWPNEGGLEVLDGHLLVGSFAPPTAKPTPEADMPTEATTATPQRRKYDKGKNTQINHITSTDGFKWGDFSVRKKDEE